MPFTLKRLVGGGAVPVHLPKYLYVSQSRMWSYMTLYLFYLFSFVGLFMSLKLWTRSSEKFLCSDCIYTVG